jgi:hypothetical protein
MSSSLCRVTIRCCSPKCPRGSRRMKPPPRVRGGGATRRAGGGGVTRRRGGGAVWWTIHISTESSDEASSWQERGGVVRWRLELPTSWREGGGATRLEGEANLPYRSRAYLFASSECLLTIVGLMVKIATCIRSNSNMFNNTSK